MRLLLALAIVCIAVGARAQGVDLDRAPEKQTNLPEAADAAPPDEPPSSLPHEAGAPVPDGYRVVTSFQPALFGSGVALFAFNWVLALVIARTDVSLADEGVPREASRNDPLMAPLIGPFIALGRDTRPGGEIALLILSGVAQAGGLGMAMLGIVYQQRYVVRVEARLTPFGVVGSF